ncbi:MAG: amidohydrolase [Alphaproteobacteria bacterium]
MTDTDLIIHNGLVVTMDGGRRVIEGGVVVVTGTTITAVGDRALLERYRASTMIDGAGDIVMPGMINTHCHAAMTVFRGLGDDVPDRLQRYIFPLEAKAVNEDLVYWGSMLGILEMIEAGVTCFADMYFFEEAVARAAQDLGMRAVVGETVMGFPVPDCGTPEEAIAVTLAMAAKWEGHDLVQVALAPHAPYSLTPAVLARVADCARDAGLPVQIHLAETQKEWDDSQAAHGMSPVALLDSVGLLNERLTAAHCIFVDEDDMALLQDSGAGVSHNVVSNTKAGKGVAPALRMRELGIPVGLGTDGAMSGNRLDIFSQMSMASKLHKLEQRDRRVAPAVDMVAMGTIDGAGCLHMAAEIGSLEPGKRADIAIVGTKSTHMRPLHDVYSALVYAAQAGDVRSTVINGRVAMQDREIQGFSRETIYREFGRVAGGIKAMAATL